MASGSYRNALRRGCLQLLVLLLLPIIPAGGSVARAQRPPAPPVKLTPDQRREVSRLVSQYRRARNDPQQRALIAQQAVELGGSAVAALEPVIAREIYPRLQSYRNKFFQQATIASKRKVGAINLQEVALLRQTVLMLQHAADFSKQAIVARGDPAVARLEQILLVRREEILKQSKTLPVERRKLHALGLPWQHCQAYWHDLLPAGEDKPKEPLSFEKYLQGEEELAAGLAAPMDARTRQILLANGRLAPQLDPEEARTILALNLTRNLLGLPPVAIDLKLSATARDHSQDMRRLKFFDHTSPVPGKTTPWDRAKLFGTLASGENIYRGAADGRVANRAWFHSPGHHKNMLGNHARVGVGRSGGCFTELFGR